MLAPAPDLGLKNDRSTTVQLTGKAGQNLLSKGLGDLALQICSYIGYTLARVDVNQDG
jgi:hypothetical protein